MPLQVSGAFHTPFMTAARNRLREAIADGRPPRHRGARSSSNVDALPHHEGKEWASLLSAQLSSPVRWKHCLHELEDLGVTDFAELGPGGVLTGMAKRTRRPAPARSRWPRPRTSTSCSSGSAPASPTGPAAPRGRAPLRQRAARRQPGRRHLHAGRRASPTARTIEVGTVLGHVGEREVRSPFAGMLQSYIAVDTERVTARQPIAWLRTS